MALDRPNGFIDRLGVLIESRTVRSFLVVLIILSVLPYAQLEEMLRPLFLAAFGAELFVRVPLLIRRRRRGEASFGEMAFLVIDFAAFLSFLPLEAIFHRHFDWLVFMRLSRLLVLLRFAKELASDLYSILTRREQLQQFGLVTVAVAALAFVSAVVLSQLDIGHDYDGVPRQAEGFWDRLWWSFRQLESADNLVANLHVHPVVGVISLGLTITGVFIVAFVIGIGANVVEQVVRAERRRRVGYSGHTIVIGPIHESEVLVREFVRIYTKNRRDVRDQLSKIWLWLAAGAAAPRAWRLPRMALLGPDDEPPPVLYEPGMRWVVYRQGDGTDAQALERIGASAAKRAILLANPAAGRDTDAITVATLAALREANPHAHVYVELLSSWNHSTLIALGEGNRVFPLDVPWFLGLFMLHHLVVPGVERLYQLLLTAEGSEMYSHVYLQASELRELTDLADEEGFIPVAILDEVAERHEVVLVGLFLGEVQPRIGEHDLIPTDGLVPWVNPTAAPTDPRLKRLGAEAGKVPARLLRGVIAIGDTYAPVRAYARALTQHPRREPSDRPEIELGTPRPPPRSILVVGYGDAVASITQRLAGLTDDAHLVVAFDGEPSHVQRLRSVLQRAGVQLEREADGRWGAALDRGGRLEVRSDPHGDAMETALTVLETERFEAVVLLAEADAVDSDARTMLRMMRLAERLLSRDESVPHVLAELASVSKGERARAQLQGAFERAGREPPRVTLVSTEQIRNYFMVHSAFVPGINEVYSQLLGERGQDLVRLPLRTTRPVRLAEIRRALAERGMIPIAFELESGEVALNPPADRAFSDARAVFAIGDVEPD